MEVMAEPKKKPGETKRPNRTGSAINTQIDDDIREQMDAFIADYNAKAEHHATLRSTIEAALKMYLTSKSHWPPKPKAR